MRTNLYWEEFAEATVNRLVRPEPGDPFLIITDTANDITLAEACLAAGLRAGADAQLMVKPRLARGAASKPGPILSDAIRASKLILEFCGGIVRAPATIEAREKGTRLLSTNVKGIEEYVIRALLDVDYEAMIRNAELVAKLWDPTKRCRVTSPQGTDVSFDLAPRKSIIGDGALSEDGEVDFFPGAQVSIAPVEETISGTIVIDASDSVQGVVHTPYSFTMVKGVITAVEGGKEADVMRNWLESRNDETIYHLCHYSIGLNPQAGISGNMIEDERMLAAIDFGFGYQDPKFGGTVGLSPYHMDIMLATPTTYIDGKEMSGGGKLNPDMGFEEM
jgi:leucyl aminopeptidase (aminopeptidase T)